MMFRRSRCWLRGKWAYAARREVWRGHVWSEAGCVDCGYTIRITNEIKLTRFEWWLDLLPERHWWWTNRVQPAVEWVLCKARGHMPVMDHCGKPEHDHCARCGRLTPWLAQPERDIGYGGTRQHG